MGGIPLRAVLPVAKVPVHVGHGAVGVVRVDDIALLAGQGAAGRALIEREAVDVSGIELLHEADFLYQGQTHVMRMVVASPGFDPARVRLQFEAMYRERFDVDLSEMRPILSALRTAIIGRRERLEGVGLLPQRAGSASTVADARRNVWFAGQWLDTPVLARHALLPGATITGPAIVEQLDTTTVIEPGDTAIVDPMGNLIVTLAA